MNMQNHHSASQLHQKISLGAGYFAVFFLGQAIPILAIPHYQMTLGVNPSLLGLLMAFPLLVASCFGVWFGHASDRFWSNYGRRRPFIFLASLVSSLSYGFLWMPPTTNHTELMIYFGCLSLLFQLSSVVYSISLNSLVYESSPHTHERTALMGFTTYFIKTGSLCYQWVYPLSVFSFAGVVLGVEGVGWLLAMVVFLLMGLLPAVVIKERHSPILEAGALSFVQALRTTLKNKPMIFILILTLLQMGGSAYAVTMDYYLLVYQVFGGDIAQGAVAKGALSTAYAVVSILSVPIILQLVRRYGRLNTLCIIYLVNTLGGILKWFIFVPGAGLWVVTDAVFCGAIWSAMVILIPSMISELAQRQGNQTQINCSGIYSSMHGWTLSVSAVLVLMFSGFTLSLIGFDAGLGGNQQASTLTWMRSILVVGTVVCSLLALFLVKRWQSRPGNYQFLG
jgi:glycoside/pentoside/hexuronide:cation symporter, GPH family